MTDRAKGQTGKFQDSRSAPGKAKEMLWIDGSGREEEEAVISHRQAMRQVGGEPGIS